MCNNEVIHTRPNGYAWYLGYGNQDFINNSVFATSGQYPFYSYNEINDLNSLTSLFHLPSLSFSSIPSITSSTLALKLH